MPGGVWYLRFDAFDGLDRRWLGAELKKHRDAPGVVLDLRQNPGGETISLGITVGEFFGSAVDCGTFITRSGRNGGKSSWQIGSAHYAGRVAILVGAGTGSAAEIFSAVLQDHGRRGVFLPSVWEQLPDARNFLNHLKRKAGLPETHWSDTVQIWRYVTEEVRSENLPADVKLWAPA